MCQVQSCIPNVDMAAYVRTTSTSNYSSSEGVSSRAARPTEAFLSRGSALEHGHYAESPSNSGSKPKEEEGGGTGRERGRTGVRGLTLNLETLRADEPPQGYLKDDGARHHQRFLILAFRVFLFETWYNISLDKRRMLKLIESLENKKLNTLDQLEKRSVDI